jgi:hypothetical protein
MLFSSWKLRANHIMPAKNLVSNIGYGESATHTNFASSMANLPTQTLRVGNEPIPLDPDPATDNIIFYLRFLESMTHTWWLDQVLNPEGTLAATREALLRKERQVRQLELEVTEKRRQLLAATRALTREATAVPIQHRPHP